MPLYEIEINMRIHESAYQETMATEMHGFLIKAVFQTKTVIGVLLVPLSYLNPITTLILGIIGSLTFKIALIPLYAIGLLMLGWLWGTSWLWLKSRYYGLYYFCRVSQPHVSA